MRYIRYFSKHQGRSGNRASRFFYSEGRTYSPLVKQAVVCLRHRALSEGDAASAEAYGQCHTLAIRCHCPRSYRKHNRQCDCEAGYSLYPTLRQLPAKTYHRQLYRRYGRLLAAHFLFAKKKQNPRAKGW